MAEPESAADRLRLALDAARRPRPRDPYPWLGLGDDPVTLNTRLGRRLSAKLEWLVGQNGTSKREAVEQAVEAWVRAEMRRHGVRDGET